MKRIVFSLLLFLLLTGADGDGLTAEAFVPRTGSSLPGECVFFEGQQQESGQNYIQFFNACNQRVWISVCLQESLGERRLEQSARPVPVGGRYQVFAFPGTFIEKFNWMSDPRGPPITPPCTQEQNPALREKL